MQFQLLNFQRLFSKITLSNLQPSKALTKPRKRWRGIANGGRSFGKGNGGAKPRGGNSRPYLTFTGGQTPLHLSLPKRKTFDKFKKDFFTLPLDRIQWLIESGRLDPDKVITTKTMFDLGIRVKDGIMVTDDGSSYFKSKIRIHASCFSPEAIECIEQFGGEAVTVFFKTERDLRMHLRPERFTLLTKFAAPERETDQLASFSYSQRGYLNPTILKRLYEQDSYIIREFELLRPRPDQEIKLQLQRQLAQ